MVTDSKLGRARGDRIKWVREVHLKLHSQEAFAEWFEGISRGAVGNWEQGKPIGYRNLLKLSLKAGVRFEWLLTGDEMGPLAPLPFMVGFAGHGARDAVELPEWLRVKMEHLNQDELDFIFAFCGVLADKASEWSITRRT